jgi:hypothetical protein
MSAIFVSDSPDHPEYVYREGGVLKSIWPTSVEVEIPIFERLTDAEEARLGNAGIRKKPVGKLVMHGECQYGCAMVTLKDLKVLKTNGEEVWSKSFK